MISFSIYKISHASTDTKGFAWAAGFGPLLNGMPFLGPVERELMDRFWKVNPMQSGLIIDPGGKKWPDYLGHGGGSPCFFVSERVMQSLRSLNDEVVRVTEMPIAEINAKPLRAIPPPKYYVLEINPGIEVDFAASNIPTDAEGKPILQPLPKPWPPIIKVRGSSWNGSALFGYSNFGKVPRLDILCTEKVKELAEREGWTNVRFEPLEVV